MTLFESLLLVGWKDWELDRKIGKAAIFIEFMLFLLNLKFKTDEGLLRDDFSLRLKLFALAYFKNAVFWGLLIIND